MKLNILAIMATVNASQIDRNVNKKSGNDDYKITYRSDGKLEDSSFCNLKQPHECQDVRFTTVSKTTTNAVINETNSESLTYR